MRDVRALKFARWVLALSTCFLFAAFTSCGEEASEVPAATEISVLVTVDGLTPAVSSLYVSTTLNGLPAQQGTEITGRLDKFAIYVPLDTSGTMNINVVARSTERCLVSSGMVEVAVAPAPPTRIDATVALKATVAGAPKACALTVQVKGKGKVTSTPAGIDCTGNGAVTSECSFDFPVGTMVTLNASYDAKSYGVAWGGACTGNGACSFQHQKPSTVAVGIAGRICSTNNWCWYTPLPQGNSLRGLWGAASDDVWAVGDFGTIV
jgi:hypothetical protein